MKWENIKENQTGFWGRYGANWMNETWNNGSFAIFDPLRAIGRVAAVKIIEQNLVRRMHMTDKDLM